MANTHRLAQPIELRIPYSNIDYNYGPYASKVEACSAIIKPQRLLGLTVAIKSGNGVEEYWFKEGVEDKDLVKKVSLLATAPIVIEKYIDIDTDRVLMLDRKDKSDKIYNLSLHGSSNLKFTINDQSIEYTKTYNDTTLVMTNTSRYKNIEVEILNQKNKNSIRSLTILPGKTVEIIIKGYGYWSSMSAIPLGGWEMPVIDTPFPPYFRFVGINYLGMTDQHVQVPIDEKSTIEIVFGLSDSYDFEDNTVKVKYLNTDTYICEKQSLFDPLDTGVSYSDIEKFPGATSDFVLEAKSVSGEIITSDILRIQWV